MGRGGICTLHFAWRNWERGGRGVRTPRHPAGVRLLTHFLNHSLRFRFIDYPSIYPPLRSDCEPAPASSVSLRGFRHRRCQLFQSDNFSSCERGPERGAPVLPRHSDEFAGHPQHQALDNLTTAVVYPWTLARAEVSCCIRNNIELFFSQAEGPGADWKVAKLVRSERAGVSVGVSCCVGGARYGSQPSHNFFRRKLSSIAYTAVPLWLIFLFTPLEHPPRFSPLVLLKDSTA